MASPLKPAAIVCGLLPCEDLYLTLVAVRTSLPALASLPYEPGCGVEIDAFLVLVTAQHPGVACIPEAVIVFVGLVGVEMIRAVIIAVEGVAAGAGIALEVSVVCRDLVHIALHRLLGTVDAPWVFGAVVADAADIVFLVDVIKVHYLFLLLLMILYLFLDP